MGAASDVCMGESRRGGMFAKVRGKNPFLSSFKKSDAADQKSQQPKHGPSSSPGVDDSMPETVVLLLLDRFSPS